jgi:hypothetical protein
MIILKLLSRLLENISSVFEGIYVILQCWLFGLVLGIGYTVHEWYDSWSVPLVPKYKDAL